MPVRTELEELAKWISGLTAKPPSAPSPTPLRREDWYALRDNLDDATKKFGEARQAIIEARLPFFLAEFAGDLERECDELALRAALLARRARPKTKAQREADARRAAAAKAEREEKEKEKEKEKAREARAKAGRRAKAAAAPEPKEKPPEPPPKPAYIQPLGSAQGTVETAHSKIGDVEEPDAVAKAFEDELDVLAEMTLGLRQRLEDAGEAVTRGQSRPGRLHALWRWFAGDAAKRNAQSKAEAGR